MATTSNTYTGNGSNKLFSITFPYLETTDVDVYLNGTLQTITTQYTFANATTIEFVAAPANGAVVLLDRSTDDATLQATFFPGSSIKAADLNLDFDQVLYIAQETSNEAATATSTAATATTTANTALSQSAAAVSTANTASSNASAAVSTANTASTNASNAVTTANTASSNATTAVNTANAATSTANSAASDASTALSTANTALTNANSAVTTANTASSNATAAVSTANTASTNASNAVTTANTASTNASNAVTTANTADTNSNTAITTANAAAAAVANAVLYTTVANVAAIPGSPANDDAVEVTNSTGIESFTPLSGLPAGFIGSSGLSVRIIYQTVGATWTWIQYFPNDPEARYLKLAGGTLTGALGITAGTAAAPSLFISGSTNTGIYSPSSGAVAISTNGTGRLFVDASGKVLVGTDTARTNLDPNGNTAPAFQIEGTVTNTASATIIRNAASAASPVLHFAKTRSATTGGVTAVIADDGLGSIVFQGADGTSFARAASIQGEADGTPVTGAVPGRLIFLTSSSGSGSPTERLRITSAGLVGIGTSAPAVSLHVRNDTTTAYSPGTAPSNITLVENLDTTTAYTPAFSQWNARGSTTTTSVWYAGNAGQDTTYAQSAFVIGNRTGASTYAERLRIDGSGNVGIGTSSPSGNLHVYNPATTSADIYLENTDGYYNFKLNNQNLDIFEGATSRLRIASGGNVGIGTASPSRELQIGDNTSAAEVISLQTTTTGNGSIYFGDNAATSAEYAGMLRYSHSDNAMQFWTSSTERARIDSSGRLLVGTSTARSTFFGSLATSLQVEGTSTPTASLSITRSDASANSSKLVLAHARGTSNQILQNNDAIGEISWHGADGSKFVQAANIYAEVDGTPGANDMPGRLVFSTTADGASSPTERFRIGSAGQLGIGGATYGTAGQVLTSGGASAAPTWSTSSGTPAGAVDYFAMSSAPTGYLKANGAAISRSTYSDLFAAIGTTFGAGDGSTTFNLPDLRGQFIRTWADDGTTYDSGRTFGSTQADEFRSHSHNITVGLSSGEGINRVGTNNQQTRSTGSAGGTETRPRNIALLACIKF